MVTMLAKARQIDPSDEHLYALAASVTDFLVERHGKRAFVKMAGALDLRNVQGPWQEWVKRTPDERARE